MTNLYDALTAYAIGGIIGIWLIIMVVTEFDEVNWNKIGKGLLSLSLIALQWLIVWKGLHGTTWAWNIFVFAQWIMTGIIFLACLMKSRLNKPVPERTMPAWIPTTSDLLLALVLAATGHFFYATLTLIQQALEQDALTPIAEESK